MTRSVWIGDYRTGPGTGVFEISLIDQKGEKYPVSIHELCATGPGSENNRHKQALD